MLLECRFTDVKWFVAAVAILVLGVVGVVVFKENSRQSSRGGTSASSAKIATISHGESVEVDDHLNPGKFTVVEFYADW